MRPYYLIKAVLKHHVHPYGISLTVITYIQVAYINVYVILGYMWLCMKGMRDLTLAKELCSTTDR